MKDRRGGRTKYELKRKDDEIVRERKGNITTDVFEPEGEGVEQKQKGQNGL